MKTYTTKIAKNGATLYYSVETGKRIAKKIALKIERKEIIANGTVKERYELAKETTELLKNKAGEKPVFKIFGNYTERAFSYAYGGWYHNQKHGWYFTNCNYWSAKSIEKHLAEMNLTVEEFIAEYNKENNIEETAEVEITEADVEDYAVSTEAQDAAIEAEIELATATVETKSEEDTEMKNQNTNAISEETKTVRPAWWPTLGEFQYQLTLANERLASLQSSLDLNESFLRNISPEDYGMDYIKTVNDTHEINDELREDIKLTKANVADIEEKIAELVAEIIDECAVTAEAQDAAIEAEIENAAHAETEEDTEMKNQNTNAVSTPAIETRIASNGAVSVYVNGKRTSREEAVEIAEQNDLPTYTAICYPYSERNYSISEEFATALSAYKWIVSKANSNRNVADGSFEIRRYTDGIKNETTIFDYTENGDEKINADDEPEFATFIYAEIGEVHISERYDRMVLFHNQLANDGLTEEQINQVLVTQYNNENGREHCNLIKEFKAQNAAIEAEIENAAQITESEPETISTDERIAEIENEIAPLVEEMKVVATDLQMFKEYPDEYTQEFIDERENLYDSLSRKYRKLVGELESLQKTPPENPKPESAETPAEPEEITFIAQNGASLTIEGGMPTIAANGNRLEVNGIWLGDYYTNEDAQEAAEALKIDVEEFGDDHPVLNKEYFAEIEFEESPTGGDRTAEHLNANAPEGWTVTRADKKINVDYHGKRVAEVDRITERDLLVPHAFFQQFQPLVDKSKTPEQIFLDDRYRELAELEEMREELQHTSPISKERLKTLDDMINQVKRDIYETEMDNPDTVASFCKAGAIDEDGNVWF